MLNEKDYEVMKSSFIDSQRLFDKLNRVADNVADLDYDESGLYVEEEETYKRHWLKLSSKIVDALSSDLEVFSIELLHNDSMLERTLTFNLLKSEERSKISVDYSEDGALSISQMS